MALGSTGGATLIGDAVSKVLGGTTNSYIVLAVLFAVPAIMTQFMNNIPVAQAFDSNCDCNLLYGWCRPPLRCHGSGFCGNAVYYDADGCGCTIDGNGAGGV